jgi:hypothetical protein
MYRCPSLFWQHGQPLPVLCSSARLVKECLSMLPVGMLPSSSGDGGNLPSPHTIITFLPVMGGTYETTAFLVFMPIAIRSLFGVFHVCTACLFF